ncbi:hypothetical protein FACS1894132_08310 [Clostridia bacterium]|nr:hypothetical protein FACS1894132_08310 [Clostridia bacterium]
MLQEHAKAEAKRYNKYDRAPATAKRYGKTWKQIRARFLTANSLCELCKAEGRFKPAELVHHKRKLSDDPSRAGRGNND